MDKNMSNTTKKIIALFISIIAAALIYLSAYLPYVKSVLYINALQLSQQSTSLQDFLNPFINAFNFWSPVGQPEEIRFFANNVLNILSQTQQIPQEVANTLVKYTVSLLDSHPLGGKGLNYSQSVLLEASIFATYGERYNDKASLIKAEELYKQGMQLSPKRPQFLYGLFALYTAQNRQEDAKNIGNEILKYWPSDMRIKQILDALNKIQK
ncbi:MAG: tetratricopeptide repeat protein [Minisyncoccia bacterium]